MRRESFEALYAQQYASIYAYVYRRLTDAASEVPDVVADAFSVAWRRLDELPCDGAARLWLRIARPVVAAGIDNLWRRPASLASEGRCDSAAR